MFKNIKFKIMTAKGKKEKNLIKVNTRIVRKAKEVQNS